MNGIKGRLFVVGCPRSGTTLLQSLVAAHEEITTFPETHFFPNVVASNWRRWFRLASPSADKNIRDLLDTLDFLDVPTPASSPFVRPYINWFVQAIDRYGSKQGASCWLEKTPRHLHYLDEIECYVRRAFFIHIVRKGRDVVASLYRVTRDYPDEWGGERSLERCVNRWLKDIRITRTVAGKRNHFAVRYEDLIRSPRKITTILWNKMDLTDGAELFEQRDQIAASVVRQEPWKHEVKTMIKSSGGGKFKQSLSQRQQEFVLNRINYMNLDEIDYVNEAGS